ncbi:MAG: trypsin-like serine protease [Gammaproteobacteria bacterium]|nr:trypsin-like serine protease [Gammaproteobacteria bacterium]
MLTMLVMVTTGTLRQSQAIVIRHDTGYSRYVASETQFPAVFWLQQRALRKVCVATLIAPQWAITAAHCVEETSLQETLANHEEFKVHIAGADVGIDQVVMHPNYPYRDDTTRATQEVDLALLRLTQPLEIPRPLALYRAEDEQDRVATFLGWGYFGIGTTGIQHDDGRFRQAKNVVTVASTRLRFNFDDPRLPGSAAVELEGLPGLGDSGGPALLETAEGWRIAGVAVGEVGARQDGEGGSVQGLYGAVGIYERLSIHQPWIDSVIGH